jgi:hypothetical protein
LYTLLIIIQAYDKAALGIVSPLIFWTLSKRNSDAFSIMKMNPSHFGLLEGLADTETNVDAFRYHLWAGPMASRDLKRATSMDIKSAIADIFNDNFIPFRYQHNEKIFLMPQLEIHPVIEKKLIALLRLTVMLRIRLDIKMHPLYFNLLFDQGQGYDCHKPQIIRTLVKSIIALQFPPGRVYDDVLSGSLQKLDALHSEYTRNHCIRDDTVDDYTSFLLESTKTTGFVKNNWRIDNKQMSVSSIIERMAVQVWSAKFSTSTVRLSVGFMELVEDPQCLIFRLSN